MSRVPALLPAVLAQDAPATPADAAIGVTWMPYLLVGVALLVVGAVARLRARGADRGLREFLVVRGSTLLLIALLIGWLADAAAEGDGLTAVDRPVWSWFVTHRTGLTTVLAKVATEVGSTGVMAVLAALAAVWLWLRAGRRGDAVLVAVVTAGAGLLVTVSKPIVGRVRPPEGFRLVTETNQSFPSGHALASVAVLGVLAIVFLPRLSSAGRRAAGWALVAAAVLAIGASRLYLGVHWPTDVAGGWLTGAGWLLACLTVRTLGRRHPVLLRGGSATLLDHRPGRMWTGAPG
ncbi:phosphatase PAP2 family protein [Nakamurella flavida]|uniref:Phosphatase PAP2 family protein n=1 Tax=Nakamurella flavida TaxID=363630 RepID=A0A938YQG3_9ACTN|nr:phosphatase PAP2 family protein [Nakamurella flavida]MBM9477353.1 phosphatase PAP2 family protein [Nakamurella flavida]MDP9777285.1 undecaprenyl-diphosphatase [Nakamurella flavida]